MKKLFIAILMAMPLIASAQDNTWERIEQAQVVKENPDAKYLVDGAVPVVDGVVCWQTTINAPGKTAKQIYDILYKQMDKMVNEPNQIANSAIVQDETAGISIIFSGREQSCDSCIQFCVIILRSKPACRAR